MNNVVTELTKHRKQKSIVWEDFTLKDVGDGDKSLLYELHTRLCIHQGFQTEYFKSPIGEEWKVVDNLCTYLKLIFDTASLLASSSVPTTNTFLNKAWKFELDLIRASTSEVNIISIITKPKLEYFDKY